jgi:hypothetical protein
MARRFSLLFRGDANRRGFSYVRDAFHACLLFKLGYIVCSLASTSINFESAVLRLFRWLFESAGTRLLICLDSWRVYIEEHACHHYVEGCDTRDTNVMCTAAALAAPFSTGFFSFFDLRAMVVPARFFGFSLDCNCVHVMTICVCFLCTISELVVACCPVE